MANTRWSMKSSWLKTSRKVWSLVITKDQPPTLILLRRWYLRTRWMLTTLTRSTRSGRRSLKRSSQRLSLKMEATARTTPLKRAQECLVSELIPATARAPFPKWLQSPRPQPMYLIPRLSKKFPSLSPWSSRATPKHSALAATNARPRLKSHQRAWILTGSTLWRSLWPASRCLLLPQTNPRLISRTICLSSEAASRKRSSPTRRMELLIHMEPLDSELVKDQSRSTKRLTSTLAPTPRRVLKRALRRTLRVLPRPRRWRTQRAMSLICRMRAWDAISTSHTNREFPSKESRETAHLPLTKLEQMLSRTKIAMSVESPRLTSAPSFTNKFRLNKLKPTWTSTIRTDQSWALKTQLRLSRERSKHLKRKRFRPRTLKLLQHNKQVARMCPTGSWEEQRVELKDAKNPLESSPAETTTPEILQLESTTSRPAME